MLPSTPAIETAFNLLIGSTIAASIGLLFASFARSAKGQSAIWKTVNVVFLCLLIFELSGTSRGLNLVVQNVLGRVVDTAQTKLPEANNSKSIDGESGDGNVKDFDSLPTKAATDFDPWLTTSLSTPIGPLVGTESNVFPEKLRPPYAAADPEPSFEFESAALAPTIASGTQPDEQLARDRPDDPPSTAVATSPAPMPAPISGRQLAGWWPLVWFGGTLLCFCRSLLSTISVFRLRRGAVAADEASQQRLDLIRQRLGIRQPVRVFAHGSIPAPIVTGTLRPAIVVPLNFASDFTPEQQDSVFAHELSHLASNDNLWLELSLFAAAIFWWCPSVWFARRRLRSAMEMAADEASLCVPDGPRHLADCLVKVGRTITASPAYAVLGMAGRGTRSSLATRVRRLLQLSDQSPTTTRPRVFLQVAVVFLFLFSSVLPGVVVRAEQPINNGETGMQLLKQSWRHSLLAGIAGALMAPGLATAQEIEVEVEYRDGDRRVEEREIVVERRRALRDRDERRERDEQREREEVRERAEERERGERGERRVTERRIRRVFSSPEAAREFELRVAREAERLRDLLAEADGRERQQEIFAKQRALQAEVLAFKEQARHLQLAERREVEQLHRRERDEHQNNRQRHIRMAIENLMAAGLHDHAERLQHQLREEGEHEERRVVIVPDRRGDRNVFEHREPQSDRRGSNVQREMNEIRAQMREMREMMHELMRRSERNVEVRHTRREHDEDRERHDRDEEHGEHHDEDHDEDHEHDHDEDHEHDHDEHEDHDEDERHNDDFDPFS